MKRLTHVLIIALVILGVSSSANALQYGFGYSGVDLRSFDYSDKVSVYSRNLGIYSAGYALALNQDEVSSDGFSNFNFNRMLEDQAIACTTNAFSEAGTDDGINFSRAEVLAGDSHGQYSAALAATFVGAYQFYVPDGGDITISIDYYLESGISGDEPGLSIAGSGAMLGIFQDGGTTDYQGHWLDSVGGYGSNFDQARGTLEVSLLDLEAGSLFSAFAFTAAYTAAYAETAPVPEPATMFLLGTGLICLAGFGRKRFHK